MDKNKLENKVEVPEFIKNLGEEAIQAYQESREHLQKHRRQLILIQTIRLITPPRRYSLTNNYQ